MFIPASFEPNALAIFKILKITDAEKEQAEEAVEAAKVALSQGADNLPSLKVLGLGPSNDILFSYQNPSQGLS